MAKFQFDLSDRVFLPGKNQVQGVTSEKRKSLTAGCSYIVTHLDSATLALVESIVTQDELIAAQPAVVVSVAKLSRKAKKSRLRNKR